jgi:hypothetical protein
MDPKGTLVSDIGIRDCFIWKAEPAYSKINLVFMLSLALYHINLEFPYYHYLIVASSSTLAYIIEKVSAGCRERS